MSILAGVVSRKDGFPPPLEWEVQLAQAISRCSSDQIERFADRNALLLKVDSGAYAYSEFRHDPFSDSVLIIAGEPLLSASNSSDRTRETALLQSELDRENWQILKNANGSFAAVYYQPKIRKLHIVADKLGIRPLYFWATEDWVVFSSALRIFEALSFVPKRMDLRAVTEMTCLGFSLGDHTPYQGICRVRAAEIVSLDRSGTESRPYWHWDKIPQDRRPERELCREAYERFQSAVQRRLHTDHEVLCLLSGGLDSRCIAASLCPRVRSLHTLNFALTKTQDRVYAAGIARKLRTDHHEYDICLSNPDILRHISETMVELRRQPECKLQRPLLLWSGDGGSVGVGCVHITQAAVDALRRGGVDAGIRQYVEEEQLRVIRRILKPTVFRSIQHTIEEGIHEEFVRLDCEDGAQRLYLFLMLNEQRHHFDLLFENLDLTRFEPLTPFYDGDFLAFIASIPLDARLLHRFYAQWLEVFPKVMMEVPWQTYPGHAKCPLRQPTGVASQFDRASARIPLQERQEICNRVAVLMRSPQFPDGVLCRSYLSFASAATRWGFRDYRYALNAALLFGRYGGSDTQAIGMQRAKVRRERVPTVPSVARALPWRGSQ